jgi:carbon storage regulator
MLVLTRRIGQEIVIGDTIRIKVLAVKGGGVRLGITAPPAVVVKRMELLAEPAPGAKARKSRMSQEERVDPDLEGNPCCPSMS